MSDLVIHLTITDKLQNLNHDMGFSDWQSESDLDIICNSCDVFSLNEIFFSGPKWSLFLQQICIGTYHQHEAAPHKQSYSHNHRKLLNSQDLSKEIKGKGTGDSTTTDEFSEKFFCKFWTFKHGFKEGFSEKNCIMIFHKWGVGVGIKGRLGLSKK